MSGPARVAGSAVALIAAVLLLVLFGPAGASGQERRAEGEHDVVFIAEDSAVEQPVRGDVQALGGSLKIDAPIAGSVVAIGTRVAFGPAGRIGGDLVLLGGSLSAFERERVEGQVWAPAGTAAMLAEPQSADALISMVNEPFSLAAAAIKLALTLGWILISIPIALLAGREVRTASLEIRASLFYSFLLGLVAFTSIVLTAIVFSYLVPYGIGVVLLVLLAVGATGLKAFGMVALFHAVGVMLAGPKTHAEARQKALRGDLALTLIGALTFGALRLVPLVGNVIWIAASIIGIGVALGTWFGRREPWFLAVTRAETTSD